MKLKNLDDKEYETIIKIVDFVKPYIPDKDNYHLFQYQVPFVLMANQVLRSIGYDGQVVKLMPIIKPTALHSFLVDTTTLYALFCSKQCRQRMFVLDFKGNRIKQGSALANKDAVFSAFFNIDQLKKISSSYGLEFANRIHILPGLKTIRIYGTVDYIQQRQKKPKAINKSIAQDEDDRLKALNNRKSDLETLFKERRKELDQFILTTKSVRASKRDWKNKVADRNKYYREVEMTKLKKRELMIGIRDVRQDLQSLKRQISEYRNPSTSLTSTTSPNPFIINSKPCHKKVEECMLDTDVNLDDVVFSGTDNGIIKTTETVYFDINRFTFHLELYNRFQILGNMTQYSLSTCKIKLIYTLINVRGCHGYRRHVQFRMHETASFSHDRSKGNQSR